MSYENRIEVLVVEDSQTQAEKIRYLLEKQNYDVKVAGDGKQAYEILNNAVNYKPSLVITDIIMPEMDGYELCKTIKSVGRTKDIPVLLLTSLSDTKEVIEGLACGADGFITKPYDNEFLISSVNNAISNNISPEIRDTKSGLEISFDGTNRVLSTTPQKIVEILLSIYQSTIHKNNELIQTRDELRMLNANLESLVEKRTSALSSEIETSNLIAEKLMESEEKWRMLVTTIPDYIGLHDKEARFQFLNHYAEGFSEKDTVGKCLFDFISDKSRESYQEMFKACISTKRNQVFEYEASGDNGIIRTYETTLVPLMQNDKLLNIMAIARDITDRKLREREILHKTEQLQSLNIEKNKFFSIIAHDLRSPFHGLLNLTEMMADAKENFSASELTDFSRSLNKSANNLYQLLENLLKWAMVENGLIGFTPEELNLSVITLQNLRLIIERAIQKKITIVNEVPDNQIIYADEEMIKTILRNLLSNAVKFTSAGGKVIIKSEINENKMIEVSVTDTGIGMSEEVMKRLFNIGEQVGSKGTDGELSTGLGLILCKEFVEKHGGTIWTESEEGQGSTFRFTIPEKR
jgi:PAS domain S-box-containing protein